ncbi:PREDICTED: uncharacterized protein LOC106103340 [Papilio polytes]|uniref:uncharacterized protein LOC106103340 n=1 Tax=Papilio polytes TaxID=76194 RepID=UPI000675D1DA|nr:PREDICTED: uncharacterized protein LOC106103340 [Papilio polytes]
MSNDLSDKSRIQDIIEAARMPLKCRIPRSVRTDKRGIVPFSVNRTKLNNTDVKQRSISRGRTEKAQVNDMTRSARLERDRISSALKVRLMASLTLSLKITETTKIQLVAL